MRSSRHLISALLAFCVFVVGTTCTSAGCLIPGPVSGGASGEHHCCANHAAKGRTVPAKDHEKPCPACNQHLYSGVAGAKDTAALSPTFDALPYPTLFSSLALFPERQTALRSRREHPPAAAPPTLFDLGCALLI